MPGKLPPRLWGASSDDTCRELSPLAHRYSRKISHLLNTWRRASRHVSPAMHTTSIDLAPLLLLLRALLKTTVVLVPYPFISYRF
ncbi:hypothetical protein NL676_000970 [Syzygium grande]|nr:hypothetical protein NL676_000970 [Syzygium grande]